MFGGVVCKALIGDQPILADKNTTNQKNDGLTIQKDFRFSSKPPRLSALFSQKNYDDRGVSALFSTISKNNQEKCTPRLAITQAIKSEETSRTHLSPCKVNDEVSDSLDKCSHRSHFTQRLHSP